MLSEPERLLPGRTAKVNLVADLVVITLALGSVMTWYVEGATVASTAWFLIAATSVWTLTSLVLRHYDPRMLRSRLEDLGVLTLMVVAPLLLLTTLRALWPSAQALPAMEPLFPLLWLPLAAIRFLVFRPLYEAEEHCGEVLVVGTGYLAQATSDQLRPRRGCQIKGYVTLPDEDGAHAPGPVVGSFNELQQLLIEMPVDEVYFAFDPTRHRGLAEKGARICEDLGLPFAVPVPSLRLGRARVNAARTATDGYISFHSDDPKPYQQAAKRLIDIVAASAAVLVLSPVLIGTALAVKLTSRGPLLFRQQRVGLRGRFFTMLKFRSMVLDAEKKREELVAQNEQEGPVFKIRHDPRVTRVGAFIRRFSIDELPQLFNVILGDMSLVGPRPPIQSEVDKYEPWQRRRLSVRPGITCIWQVSGRNNIPFDRWMVLDMKYIDNWSLGLDLSLLVRTIPAVLAARGAS